MHESVQLQVDTGCPPQCLPTLFLLQGFLLNLELTGVS